MAKRFSPHHTTSCTIRLTPKEKEIILEYCKENSLTVSEYFRYLARTHLDMNVGINKIQSATPKKEEK